MADFQFPSLLPKVVDSAWFCVDKPVDDHEELCKLEEEHQTWVSINLKETQLKKLVELRGLPEYCKSPQINLKPGQKVRPQSTLSQSSWQKKASKTIADLL